MRHYCSTPNPIRRKSSRRDVLKWSGKTVAASMLAEAGIPAVYAAEDKTIRLALIGCGGRGCGAVANAFDSPNWPVKSVAMAHFFENRLAKAHKVLSEQYVARMDVPIGRRFIGFEANLHYEIESQQGV